METEYVTAKGIATAPKASHPLYASTQAPVAAKTAALLVIPMVSTHRIYHLYKF